MTDKLKKGDRVTVVIPTPRRQSSKPQIMHGEIRGESRRRHAWIIKRDDIKTPYAYHKDFCHPEDPL